MRKRYPAFVWTLLVCAPLDHAGAQSSLVLPRDTSSFRADSTQPYFEFQVQQSVRKVPGTGMLQYPDVLRAARVQGEVLVQFIVNADGSVRSNSFKVIKSSHSLFTEAVKDALPTFRYVPAMIDGLNVAQLVQQPFTFSLSP